MSFPQQRTTDQKRSGLDRAFRSMMRLAGLAAIIPGTIVWLEVAAIWAIDGKFPVDHASLAPGTVGMILGVIWIVSWRD